MKTAKAVADGNLNTKLTDEQLGAVQRRTNELVRRINSGTLDYEWVLDRLQSVIEGFCLPFCGRRITIKLGTHRTSAELLQALKNDSDLTIGYFAEEVMKSHEFTVASEQQEVEIALLRVGNLGFRNRTTRAKLYERAQRFDLKLCPAEVGPQLRLQAWKNQVFTLGSHIHVAMEAIDVVNKRASVPEDPRPHAFCVNHIYNPRCNVNSLELITDCGNPDYEVGDNLLFAFILPADTDTGLYFASCL